MDGSEPRDGRIFPQRIRRGSARTEANVPRIADTDGPHTDLNIKQIWTNAVDVQSV